MLLDNQTVQIDSLLDKMAEEIQLNQTRYNQMIAHYGAVKGWIEADEQFFKPYRYDVYPHGSVRILTTVKPLESDEFDLDIAIHLRVGTATFTPDILYSELKRRLLEHDAYAKMVEAKNRCLRLNYAGDFHMDILPGIQENIYDEDKLQVPDRELKRWVSSNPRGYANWFINKANLVRESLLENAFKAEEIPVDNFDNKKPLQRAVQLIKRSRDLYFQRDAAYKTSSIILTTLAGQFHTGEESIFNTVDNIVTNIHENIIASSRRIKVLNPVHLQEDFTDKWDYEPQYFEEFKNFCYHLYKEWQELKKQQGVLKEGKILKGLFGEELFYKAQTNQSNLVDQLRKDRKLAINKSNGVLTTPTTSSTVTVRSNTFFGGQ